LSVDLHQSAFIKALSGPARAEIAEYLVRLGIDSISLLPDTVLRTALAIIEIKKKLGRSPAPGRPEPRHRLHPIEPGLHHPRTCVVTLRRWQQIPLVECDVSDGRLARQRLAAAAVWLLAVSVVGENIELMRETADGRPSLRPVR
jgi:hypothetical protein